MKTSDNILLKTKDRELLVSADKVLFFESQRNYFKAVMSNGRTYLCRGTLATLEKLVDDETFFRIHSAFLINLNYVTEGINDGCVRIREYSIPISRSKQKEFSVKYDTILDIRKLNRFINKNF